MKINTLVNLNNTSSVAENAGFDKQQKIEEILSRFFGNNNEISEDRIGDAIEAKVIELRKRNPSYIYKSIPASDTKTLNHADFQLMTSPEEFGKAFGEYNDKSIRRGGFVTVRVNFRGKTILEYDQSRLGSQRTVSLDSYKRDLAEAVGKNRNGLVSKEKFRTYLQQNM